MLKEYFKARDEFKSLPEEVDCVEYICDALNEINETIESRINLADYSFMLKYVSGILALRDIDLEVEDEIEEYYLEVMSETRVSLSIIEQSPEVNEDVVFLAQYAGALMDLQYVEGDPHEVYKYLLDEDYVVEYFDDLKVALYRIDQFSNLVLDDTASGILNQFKTHAFDLWLHYCNVNKFASFLYLDFINGDYSFKEIDQHAIPYTKSEPGSELEESFETVGDFANRQLQS